MAGLVAAVRNFAAEEEGATLVEYSLVLAVLAAACIAILWGISQNVNYVFRRTVESTRSVSSVITSAS